MRIPFPYYAVNFVYSFALGIVFFLQFLLFITHRSFKTLLLVLIIPVLIVILGDIPREYLNFVSSSSNYIFSFGYTFMFTAILFLGFYVIIEYFLSIFYNIWMIMKNYEKIFLVIFSLYLILSIAYFGYMDKTIHIFDPTAYWYNSAFDSLNFKFPWHNLVTDSIFQDYRSIINIPIAIIMKIFGTHRAIYQISLVITQVLPMIIVLGVFIKKHSDINSNILVFLIPLIFSVVIINNVLAFPFISIIFLTTIALLAYYDDSLSINKKILVFTNSVLLMFIIKRWGLYASINVCLIIFINTLFTFKMFYLTNIKELWKKYYFPIICAFYIIVLFFGMIGLKTVKALMNNYSNSYSAYRESPYNTIVELINTLGSINVILFAIGVIIAIYSLKNKKTSINFAILVSLVFVYLLFYMTQTPDIHQMTIFTFSFIYIISLPITGLYKLLELKHYKKTQVLLLSLVLVFVVNTTQKFAMPNTINTVSFSQYEKLLKYISNKTAYFIVCFGKSSRDFIDSVKNYSLLNTGKSFDINSRMVTKHIDLRDGIPSDLLDSDIVITTENLRMCEVNQYIMSYPFELFQKNMGIAQAFRLLDKLDIDGEITYIYEKTRPITKEEKEEFYSYFSTIYPNNPLFPEYKGE